jgi:hypothetical protein
MPESILKKMCKIVSDGTIDGTHITDPDGNEIPLVQRIEINLDANGDQFSEVKITLLAELDMNMKVTEVILDKKDIIE